MTRSAAKYTVHFLDHRARKKETVRTSRVILAAGTMNTLRLLFAGSSQSAGLSPMPSLGRTFGGNGDLIGAWFKKSAEPPLFKSAPVLGRFKVDGQDTPFTGMWALAGIDSLPLPPGVKRKLAKALPLIGMGADTGRRRYVSKMGACMWTTNQTNSRSSREFATLSAHWAPRAA